MKKRGFSLIEVIVSLVVFSTITLGVCAALFYTGTKPTLTKNAANTIMATYYARETMENLKNHVSVLSGPGDLGEPLVDSGLPKSDPITSGPFFANASYAATRNYQVDDIMDGFGRLMYKKVTVTVTWNE
ncbi:MAG TPA: prepilin-type N-terminal cleavage/methylation domain-containing protein [Candidatus Omnitrophota bacterium]|nr:prepilin-type N-terminal cleavage/methylation domain-containing protein [Candidatus Omnitrophota bacterium]